jgi:uncharacterized membrane protein YdfJ with MMPL/SSD domain
VPMVRSASFSEVLFPMPATHPYDPAEPSTGCQPTQKRFITPRRATLVPALVAIMGRWNWCLPAGVARILQIPPTT